MEMRPASREQCRYAEYHVLTILQHACWVGAEVLSRHGSDEAANLLSLADDFASAAEARRELAGAVSLDLVRP